MSARASHRGTSIPHPGCRRAPRDGEPLSFVGPHGRCMRTPYTVRCPQLPAVDGRFIEDLRQLQGRPYRDLAAAHSTMVSGVRDVDDDEHAAHVGPVATPSPAPPGFAEANPAARLSFVGFDPRRGRADLQARRFHPAPSARFAVHLQGVMSITTTDGATRQFGPGDVPRVEDAAPCKGHLGVVGARTPFAAVSR